MAFWDRWINKSTSSAPVVDPQVQAHITELCDVLRRLIALLEADGENHWRNWMAESLAHLEANDVTGARRLMGAYGGMGSFNDLIIGQSMTEEGFQWAADAAQTNDELSALRSQAYGLAAEIVTAGRER